MRLRDLVGDAARDLGSNAERIWRGVREAEQSTALAQLLRPDLGPTPMPLRRLLEPVVAVAALTALVWLASLGLVAFMSFAAAALLIYAIIRYVFGIELDLQTPQAG